MSAFPVTCPPDTVRCDNSWGQCIFISKICNGVEDCEGGWDERNCATYRPPCGENYFRCDDGTCIQNWRKCDGRKDCESGIDEMNCILPTHTIPSGPNMLAILLPTLLCIWLLLLMPIVVYVVKKRRERRNNTSQEMPGRPMDDRTDQRQRRRRRSGDCQHRYGQDLSDSTLAIPGLFMPLPLDGRNISQTQMNLTLTTARIGWSDDLPPGYETDPDPPKYADSYMDRLAGNDGTPLDPAVAVKTIPGSRIWDDPPPAYKLSPTIYAHSQICPSKRGETSGLAIVSDTDNEVNENQRDHRRKRSAKRLKTRANVVPQFVLNLARLRQVDRTNVDTESSCDEHIPSVAMDNTRPTDQEESVDASISNNMNAVGTHGDVNADDACTISSPILNAGATERQRTQSESHCYENTAFESDLCKPTKPLKSVQKSKSTNCINILENHTQLRVLLPRSLVGEKSNADTINTISDTMAKSAHNLSSTGERSVQNAKSDYSTRSIIDQRSARRDRLDRAASLVDLYTTRGDFILSSPSHSNMTSTSLHSVRQPEESGPIKRSKSLQYLNATMIVTNSSEV
ncbi:unnamed protein product [Owenia fusiformis]|uniref:Uncharacterized protein n=1 Tax=Owenia fusiformis TaxID=6347 RepID=A0A8J1Y7E0_OWEFU|nr:unnamed protein product [Owenia fusiformis]